MRVIRKFACGLLCATLSLSCFLALGLSGAWYWHYVLRPRWTQPHVAGLGVRFIQDAKEPTVALAACGGQDTILSGVQARTEHIGAQQQNALCSWRSDLFQYLRMKQCEAGWLAELGKADIRGGHCSPAAGMTA